MISVSNYSETIQKVDLQCLPKVLQDGHRFFLASNHWYGEDETVKETIDLYLVKIDEQLSKTKAIDRDFVVKFLKMNEKVKTKRQSGLFIKSIQKAIITKKIRRSSLMARHIVRMQEVLIDHYNKLPDKGKVKIAINDTWKNDLNSALKTPELDGFDQLSISDSSIKKKREKRFNLFNSMD